MFIYRLADTEADIPKVILYVSIRGLLELNYKISGSGVCQTFPQLKSQLTHSKLIRKTLPLVHLAVLLQNRIVANRFYFWQANYVTKQFDKNYMRSNAIQVDHLLYLFSRSLLKRHLLSIRHWLLSCKYTPLSITSLLLSCITILLNIIR